MATYSDLREYLLDTLWSQWHELGVAATVPRRYSDDFIDPEPLIAFTAAHSDLDPRLRDESIDWILRCTYVSKARLKNVVADWGLRENTLFREYAATVNAHGGAGWPAARAKPLPFRSPRARFWKTWRARRSSHCGSGPSLAWAPAPGSYGPCFRVRSPR